MQNIYLGDNNIGAVKKVVNRKQSVMVGGVMEKDFSVSKKKRRIFKDITALCFHVERSGSLQKPLKFVWCGIDTYFI